MKFPSFFSGAIVAQFKNSLAVKLTAAFKIGARGVPLALAALIFPFPQAYAQSHSTTDPMPPALTGNWQVAVVHIDSGASRTPQYRQNDPRLMGRIFSISPEKIKTNTPE